MAAGALAVAHESDIDVPGQLSIAGFDDLDLARGGLAAAHHHPASRCTSSASAAAELILGGSAPQPRVTLGHQLVVRASTGPAAR